MSNIEQYLADILAARYGEEVRQSIHDAIEQCYEDGRAGAIDLEAREDIAALDTRVETLENDTTTAAEVTYDDTSTQLGATDVQGAIGALNNNLANCWKIAKASATFTNVTINANTNYQFIIPLPDGLTNVIGVYARATALSLACTNMYRLSNSMYTYLSNLTNTDITAQSVTVEVVYAYT